MSYLKALTARKAVVYVCTIRDGKKFSVQCSVAIHLREIDGWNRFMTFLHRDPTACGWCLPAIPNSTLTSLLGFGATLTVYEATLVSRKESVVVKVFHIHL